MTNVGHAPILSNMTEQADFAPVPQLTLGWRIQMALEHGGLKHTDLMEKFEVSRGTVSRWCRDIGQPPKKFMLNEIAVMCGVNARWLIDGTEPLNPGDGPGATPDRGNSDYKAEVCRPTFGKPKSTSGKAA